MSATPDPFRLNQSPLGAGLQPQAPNSVGRSPSPEGLSLARAGSTFARFTPILADRDFHPCGTPGYEMGLDVWLTIANALSSWRCARYAHYP